MPSEQADLLISLLIQMEHRGISAAPSRELINFVSTHPDRINKTEEASSLPAQALLHRAAFLGNKLLTAWLLIKGADINAVDGDGKAPLDHAIVMGHQDLAEYLRGKGAHAADEPFIDNQDGTVTDSRSGLTWMRCSIGQTWAGGKCIGNAGLFDFNQANSHRINFAGKRDWRLPNKQELFGLTNDLNFARKHELFPNTPRLPYWSSSLQDPNLAWCIDFSDSALETFNLSATKYIRLVRDLAVGEQSPTSEPDHAEIISNDSVPSLNTRFIDNLDGTATDTKTGLTWMRCALGQTWDGSTCIGDASKHSLNEARSLQQTFYGHDDWRVPNIYELKSIIDLGRNNPAIDTEVFPNTPSSLFWSSSLSPSQRDYALFIYFGDGSFYNIGASEGNCNHVRLVRGGLDSDKSTLSKNRNNSSPTDQTIKTVSSNSSKHSDTSLHFATLLERLDLLENRLDASISRVEELAGLLFTGQSKAQDAINLLLHISSTGTVNFTTEIVELRKMFASTLQSINASVFSAPQRIANQEPEVSVEYSMAAFSAWLLEQDSIPLSELRIRLLPLDLLPSAIINDINERALDLTGEPALIEDGDNVIVQREVLSQVIAE